MTKEKIRGLIARMSLAEKALQLTQLRSDFYPAPGAEAVPTGPFLEADLGEEELYCAGSVLAGAGAEAAAALQRQYMAKNPQGIPLLLMSDVIHGLRTVFPIPLALGCAFDEALAEEAARIAALEAAFSGLHVTFSPMADLARDPRWGRVMESAGEDPFLNARYAAAMVRGYQGDDPAEAGRIGCCVKHFAAYGAAEAGRDYNTVDMSEGVLREFYLPAYKAAVDAGCLMVMTSFNTVFRVPATANPQLLTGLLREEWGFAGTVISDHTAVSEVMNHSTAETGEEAARLCFEAGLDIEMMSLHFHKNLAALVERGEIPEEKLDAAVERVLELKNALGLFEKPFKDADPQREKQLILCAGHRAAARRIAGESAVLLKNDGCLPLATDAGPALVGPFAASRDVLGGWSVFGRTEDCVSLYDALKGRGIAEPPAWEESRVGIDRALEHCRDSGIVIAALGEPSDDTGEAKSKARIGLSAYQEELLCRLAAQGKKVITVVFSGRPLILDKAAEYSAGLFMAWFLGVESGSALADLLYGEAQPGGRLAMTFPRCEGQIPLYYNHYNTGRPPKTASGMGEAFVSAYLDTPNTPLYPFGFGLGYGERRYSAPRLSSARMAWGGSLRASVTAANPGSRPQRETVQLYIRDLSASVVRPVKELKGYRKIDLAPGEEREVSFDIPMEALSFVNGRNQTAVEPGRFRVYIGPDSGTDNQAEFVLDAPEGEIR